MYCHPPIQPPSNTRPVPRPCQQQFFETGQQSKQSGHGCRPSATWLVALRGPPATRLWPCPPSVPQDCPSAPSIAPTPPQNMSSHAHFFTRLTLLLCPRPKSKTQIRRQSTWRKNAASIGIGLRQDRIATSGTTLPRPHEPVGLGLGSRTGAPVQLSPWPLTCIVLCFLTCAMAWQQSHRIGPARLPGALMSLLVLVATKAPACTVAL
jgi:hypothetical protein